MKKLFISQPMKDKTNDEILKEREKAIVQEVVKSNMIALLLMTLTW